VYIDVADWNPLNHDVIETPVRLHAPVALELAILPLIVAASLDRFSSVSHSWSVFYDFYPACMMTLLSPVGYWTKVARVIILRSRNRL